MSDEIEGVVDLALQEDTPEFKLGALDVVAASTDGALPLASLRRAAIASSSFSRWPSAVTPSSFRFSCVKLGRTVSSISFSRNAASYFPRPRLRSQTTMSMMTPATQGWRASWSLPQGVSIGVRDNRTLHVSEARRLGG